MKEKKSNIEILKVKGIVVSKNVYFYNKKTGSIYSLKHEAYSGKKLDNVFAQIDVFFDEHFGKKAKQKALTSIDNFVKSNYPVTYKKISEIKNNILTEESKSFEDMCISYGSLKDINKKLAIAAVEIYHKNVDKLPDKESYIFKNDVKKSEMVDFVNKKIEKILEELAIKKTKDPIEKTAQAYTIFGYLSKNLTYSMMHSDVRGRDNNGVLTSNTSRLVGIKDVSEQVKKSYNDYASYLLTKNPSADEKKMNEEYTKNYIGELASYGSIAEKLYSIEDPKLKKSNIKVLYTILKDMSGVCYDFSILYEEIMNRLDIPCLTAFTVAGGPEGFHAVNIVTIKCPTTQQVRNYGLCLTSGVTYSTHDSKAKKNKKTDIIDVITSGAKEKDVNNYFKGFGVGKEGIKDYFSHTGKAFLATDHDIMKGISNFDNKYELYMSENDMDKKSIKKIEKLSLDYYKKNKLAQKKYEIVKREDFNLIEADR